MALERLVQLVMAGAVSRMVFRVCLLYTSITIPLLLPDHVQAAMITTGVLAPFVAGSAFMAYKGSSLLGQSRRFRRYVEELRDREFCQIRELADALGKSEDFVKKDVGKMIRKRLFLHGHLDKAQTCLMAVSYTHLAALVKNRCCGSFFIMRLQKNTLRYNDRGFRP